MKDKSKSIMKILVIILFLNLFVALCKIIVGNMIKSASMSADGFHSLSDGASNVVGIIGIWYASKPIDKEHPYGHKKFETLAGLFIGGMLLLVGGKVAFEAVGRFFNPVVPNVNMESIITMIVTLAINIFVSRYEYSAGKKLNSQILVSDSLHTRSDIYVSISVFAALVSMKLGLPSVIDPIVSLIVAGFIFHAAYEIFMDTSGVLVDKAVVESDKIRGLVLAFSQVKDVHGIRSRGREDNLYIDLHILTDPQMSVKESHDLIHEIEDKIRIEICEEAEVIVHLEPFYEDFKK